VINKFHWENDSHVQQKTVQEENYVVSADISSLIVQDLNC